MGVARDEDAWTANSRVATRLLGVVVKISTLHIMGDVEGHNELIEMAIN